MIDSMLAVASFVLLVALIFGVPYLIGLVTQLLRRQSAVPNALVVSMAFVLTVISFGIGIGLRVEAGPWQLSAYALTFIAYLVGLRLGSEHGWKLISRRAQTGDHMDGAQV